MPIEVLSGLVGIPFVWGGKDRSGTDCIGAVVLLFKACGIAVKDSDGQLYSYGWWKEDPQRFIRAVLGEGELVAPDQLRVFDVVCFQIDGVVRHIGVYVGYGKFFHAYKDASSIDRLSGMWGGRLSSCVRLNLVRDASKRSIVSSV